MSTIKLTPKVANEPTFDYLLAIENNLTDWQLFILLEKGGRV